MYNWSVDKKLSRIIGAVIFILGSILFWYLISSNNSEGAVTLKKTYFIGIFCVIGLVVFQELTRRISKSQTLTGKLSLAFLFLLVAIILYLLISDFFYIFYKLTSSTPTYQVGMV